MCNVPFSFIFFCNALSFQILQLVDARLVASLMRVFIKDKWFSHTCEVHWCTHVKLGVDGVH